MAKTDKTDLSPEERAARCLLRRHDLRVPIKVEELALHYADLEEANIPVATDGVVIHHPRHRGRPLIVLNRQRRINEVRRRFTLAHELGHLKIGWHPGTIACDIENGRFELRAEHSRFETEANRFASELLMPTNWIIEEIERHGDIKSLYLAVMKGARVSHSAARIKLLQCLSSGYVCVEEDNRKSEFRLDASDYGLLNKIATYMERQNPNILYPKLEKFAVDGFVIRNKWTTIRWWKLDLTVKIDEIKDIRHSTEVLKQMLKDCGLEGEDSLKCSINGKIGATNSRELGDAESLYGALLARFDRSDIGSDANLHLLRSHPDFELFLQKKSLEIIEKRGKVTQDSFPQSRR